jgi:hypothetical protein
MRRKKDNKEQEHKKNQPHGNKKLRNAKLFHVWLESEVLEMLKLYADARQLPPSAVVRNLLDDWYFEVKQTRNDLLADLLVSLQKQWNKNKTAHLKNKSSKVKSYDAFIENIRKKYKSLGDQTLDMIIENLRI